MKCPKCDQEINVVSVHKIVDGTIQIEKNTGILDTFIPSTLPHYSLFCINCKHEIGDIIKLIS